MGFPGNDASKFENMSGGLFYGGLFAAAVLILFLFAAYLSWRELALAGMCGVFALSLGVNYGKMRLACDINKREKVQDLQDYAPKIRGISEEFRYVYVDKSAKRRMRHSRESRCPQKDWMQCCCGWKILYDNSGMCMWIRAQKG